MSNSQAGSRTRSFFRVVMLFCVLLLIGLVSWLVFTLNQQNLMMASYKEQLNKTRTEFAEVRGSTAMQSGKLKQVTDALAEVKSGLQTARDAINKQAAVLDNSTKSIQSIAELSAGLEQVRNTIDQQSAILDRALGKMVPVKMPDEWDNRLSELENQVNDKKNWPTDAMGAQVFQQQLNTLLKELPAWAEDHYASRLGPVRWSAYVFQNLYSSAAKDDSKIDLIRGNLQGAIDAANGVDGIPSDLLDKVKKELKSRQEKALTTYREDLIERAQTLLKENKEKYKSADLAEIENVITLLSAYENDKEVQDLQKNLHTKDLKIAAEVKADSIREQLKKINKLKDTHEDFYNAGIQQLASSVQNARMNLALEGITTTPLNDLYSKTLDPKVREIQTKIQKQNEENQAKAIREYQRYALSNIRKFEKRFNNEDAIAESVIKQIKAGDRFTYAFKDLPHIVNAILGTSYEYSHAGINHDEFNLYSHIYKSDFNDYLKYQICKDAIVTYLLPINVGYLDIPVMKKYQEVFDNGWNQLDGRDEQTEVAAATVTTEKKSLSDFVEDEK